MKNPRLLPDQQKLKEAMEKKRADQVAQLRRDFNEVFGTPAGKNVLRQIMHTSGFLKSDVVAEPDSGKLLVKSSLYNMAFRNFYLKIRAYIRPDILRDVEIPGQDNEAVSAEVDIFS